MQLLKALSFTTLAVLFTLMFIGGYVGASGVGLTCPDWPLCPQGLLPHADFIIEYIHRSFAATTGLLVIATMAFTLKSKYAPRGMKIASIIAAGAVIGQVTLGAIVIVERLHAVLVTAHLGLGLVLFSMVLMTVLYAFKMSRANRLYNKPSGVYQPVREDGGVGSGTTSSQRQSNDSVNPF